MSVNEREGVTVVFGFTPDWVKKWRELFSASCVA